MAKLIADNLFITDGYLDANTEVRSIEELIAKLSDTNGFMGMSVHMPEAFYSESGIAYPLDVWAVPFGEDEAKWEIKNIPSLVDEVDFEHFKTFCNDFKTQAGYYPLPVGAEVIVSGEKYVFGVGEDGAQAWENVQDSTDTALSDTIDYVMNEIKGDVSEENDTMAKIEANINSVKESLDSKQDALIAGNGIAIEDGTISCTLDTTLFKVVESLPETPEVGSEGKIYISLNDKGSEDNSYIEYVWINGKWEKFGEYKADVDLTQYQRIEDENLNTSAKTVTGAINEVNQKSAVRVDIPIRNLRQQVYTKEEILGWFNVESETELKRLIAYGGQMYLDFGISLSGNPMRYRMPIDYCAFETATRIKVNFIGLNTRDDSPVQYTIVMNLDGALNENNSNVMLRMDDILQDESLEEITSMAHTHDNKTVLDGISAEKVAAWDASEANSKSYTDEKIDKVNGSIDAMDKTLETLSEASHTHDNKDVIDGITDVDITAWNASEKNAKDYADTQIKKLSDSVAEQMNGKLNREEEALNTENKDVVEAINSIKETTDDLIMKDGLRVRIPLRTPLNKIYTQEEILGWFGVKDIPELKRYIVGGGLFYVEYGIQLSGNPYYYKMPADYCAFETANQIKLCFVGLNTRDDSPVRYTILMNLDGTVTEGSSNVSIAMDSIAYQSDIPSIDVEGIKSEIYNSGASYTDVAVGTLKGEVNDNMELKQNRTDETLNTEDKTIVGAINEIDNKLSAKGIYNMGNFNTLEEASERACNGGIYDNINYKVLLFTVNNEGSGIIINNADHYKTRQYMYYNMHRYTRYFTRVENLAYVTEWVIDENVLFPDKGVISDELFSLGKESTSDNVKSALTMPNSEGVLTKDDLDVCAEKGYFLKSYEGTSPIAVGKTATNSHYVLTYCGPDIRLGTINGSCIKTVFIDISDSGEYSVFSGASVERLITDKSKILPAHVALPAILSDKVYPKETIMEWFGCSSYDEMMDRFSGADTIYMDYGANNLFKTIKMLIHSIIFETSEPIVEFYAIGGSRITGTGAYIHHFKADMNGEVISGNSNVLFESEELAPKAELDSLKSEVEALKQAVAEMRNLMNWQEGESGGEIQ